MSEDKPANDLSAEDSALVSEFGEENVNVDTPENSENQAEESSDVDQGDQNQNDDNSGGDDDQQDDAGQKNDSDDSDDSKEETEDEHNPDLTLEEDQPSQSVQDGINLGKRWENFSDEEKSEKISNLSKGNRKETLDALAKELGESTEDLISQFGTSEDSEVYDRDAVKEELLEELREEMGLDATRIERNRFVLEVEKWGEHNNLSKEQIQELSKIDGNVAQAFEYLKYDPESGRELSFKGRLKMALKHDSAQKMVTDALVKSRSEKIANGAAAKLPGTGGKESSKPDLMDMDDADFLEESDRLSGERTW